MLKSKFVFLLVLLSLLLNITHDIVLANEFNETCSVNLEHKSSVENDVCCNNMIDLHKVFHFTAILSSLSDINFFDFLYRKLNFVTFFPLASCYQNSFRPPIV
ncbi:MAG TPA: hypothetical protein EYG94_01660 [Campylobacterales bacterium]|nr:hypothetical protein [Campylobacterales bacterium]